MPYLMKEEPSNYNYDAFAKDGGTTWTGVKNPVAQKNLRSDRRRAISSSTTTRATRNRSSASRRRRRTPIPIRPTHGQGARRRSRAGEEAQAPGDAERDQSGRTLQRLSADLPAAAVGHAGDGRAVEDDPGNGRSG